MTPAIPSLGGASVVTLRVRWPKQSVNPIGIIVPGAALACGESLEPGSRKGCAFASTGVLGNAGGQGSVSRAANSNGASGRCAQQDS